MFYFLPFNGSVERQPMLIVLFLLLCPRKYLIFNRVIEFLDFSYQFYNQLVNVLKITSEDFDK